MEIIVGPAIIIAAALSVGVVAINALAGQFVLASVWWLAGPWAVVGLLIIMSNLKGF